MKLRQSRRLILGVALLIVSGSLVVYAATLFTQIFPATTLPPGLVANELCSGGHLTWDQTDSEYSGTGGAAILVFGCGPSPSESAFSTAGSTSETINATPTFTAPAGYSLWVGDSISCNGIFIYYVLTSGTPVSLQGGTTYWYCLTSNSATSFVSFNVTWSQ